MWGQGGVCVCINVRDWGILLTEGYLWKVGLWVISFPFASPLFGIMNATFIIRKAFRNHPSYPWFSLAPSSFVFQAVSESGWSGD